MFDPAGFDEFSYDGFSFDAGGEEFRASFALTGPAGRAEFVETVHLPSRNLAAESPSPRIARLLALATGLSYYKAAAPARISVAFGLTDAERVFLTELIRNGLGEFAYRNRLPSALWPEIVGERLAAVPGESAGGRARGDVLTLPPLVPVGGGKDSVVTIESLKAVGADPTLFSVNTFPPIERCAQVSGLKLVSARRRIDPRLIAANRDGALNGHIPVTAIVSLIALLAAERLGLGPVVMSTERSAAYGNLDWQGMHINHQWSKSLEFEKLLRAALSADGPEDGAAGAGGAGLDPDLYFSLLRPLSELEIARRFAKLPAYFGAFTSCNRAFRLNEETRASAWCRECPKCQFVFLILAPFIPAAELTAIFGGNLLDDEANLTGYAEILGLSGHKPFECVGEYSEALLALEMLGEQSMPGEQPGWRGARLVPRLAERVRAQGATVDAATRADLFAADAPHAVPPAFRTALDALA
jgi:hypothetical protein